MSTSKSGIGVFVALALFAGTGCNHESAARPPAAATGSADTSSAAPAQAKSGDRVGVSDDVARACNVTFDNPQAAPKFDLDVAELTPEDRGVLDQVARCVTTGPLHGARLSLVGRADPRGEEEYNMVLGGSRAAAVRAYLMQAGVPAGSITTSSRGKLDATGSDEQSWRLDRRVDIGFDKGAGAPKSDTSARMGTMR